MDGSEDVFEQMPLYDESCQQVGPACLKRTLGIGWPGLSTADASVTSLRARANGSVKLILQAPRLPDVSVPRASSRLCNRSGGQSAMMAGCSSLHSNEHLVGVRREALLYPSFRRRRVPDPFREPAAWDFTFVSSKRKASGCNGQLVVGRHWQAGLGEYFKKPVREGQPEPRQSEGQRQIWLVSSTESQQVPGSRVRAGCFSWHRIRGGVGEHRLARGRYTYRWLIRLV